MASVNGKRLVIIGGGISGLSCAHYIRNFSAHLKKHFNKIIILESNDYMGGSIKSNLFDDGMVHELGPRSIRRFGPRAHNTVALLEQLGLGEKILPIKANSKASNKFIYNKGQLLRLSISPAKIFNKLPGCESRYVSALMHDLKTSKMDLEQYPHRDPPLYDFIKHRFGPDAAEYIADPIMRGITAGDVRKLSSRGVFPELVEKEQTYGSIIKSNFMRPVTKSTHDELYPYDIENSKLIDKLDKDHVISCNLSTGLQSLPEYLCNSLLNTNEDGVISIFNQTKVKSLKFNLEKDDFETVPCSIEVETVDGDQVKFEADHVVAAISSKQLAELLPKDLPDQQKEAFNMITSIPHSPIGCVCVEYRELRGPKPKVLDSFGFLTHSKSGSRLLGIAFDTTMFPTIDEPFNSTRMTAMIGGSWFKEILGTDDTNKVTNAQLEQIALEEIKKILGIKDEPYAMSTILWKTGIAQYEPGHLERLRAARQLLKEQSVPITLIGQSYDGFSINDVIFIARMAAHGLVKSLP